MSKEEELEKDTRRFATGACGKAKVLLAGALKNDYVFAAALLIAAGAAIHLAGAELFQLALAEQSAVAQAPDQVSTHSYQQASTGNSHYRSVSESLSVTTSHGSGSSGSNSPTSHYRSMSESMSVSSIQGKAPNSYSRSMSEQASLTTGMPPAPAGPQLRAVSAPAAPYSASSNQRIDERLSPTLKNLSRSGDATAKSMIGGTPYLIAESSGSMNAGSPDQFSETGEISDDASSDDSSALLRQLAAVKEYMLMQESIENVVLLNASVSAVFLLGAITVVVAKQPAVSRGGKMQKRTYAIFLLKRKSTHVLLAAVIFVVSPIAVSTTLVSAQEYETAGDSSKSVIEILAAQHLDSDRRILGDIYEESRELDGIWSEEIPDGHYVRVTFEKDLTSSNDITVYPRVISGSPRLQIFEMDGTEIVAELTSMNSNQYNKVFLSNLQGGQNSFDLRIIGGNVEFDHIIDPTAPQFQSHVTVTGTSNSLVFNKPSGTVRGDLLVAFIGFEKGSSVTITPPSGWTLIQRVNQLTNVGAAAYYKIAGASEPTSYTFTLTENPKSAGGMARYSGVDPSNPINVSATNSGATSSTSHVAPSVTTTTNNAKVLVYYTSKKPATYTPASGTTERWDFPNTSGGLPSNMMADFEQVTTGATGTKIATASEAEVWTTITVALAPIQPITYNRSITESLSIAETATRLPLYAIADNMSITEAISTMANKPLTDPIVVTDTITMAIVKAMTEQLTVTDEVAKTLMQPRLASEQLGLADAVDISINKPLSESLSMTDAMIKLAVQSRPMTEQLTIQDVVSAIATRGLSEQFGATDAISRIATTARAASEQLAVTDTVQAVGSKVLAEQLVVQDALARSATLSRAATESLALQDTTSMAVSKIMTEQAAVTDQAARTIALARSASEQLIVADTVDISINKPLSESLGVTDTIARSAVQSRAITEQMTVQDTASVASSKALPEQLGMADAATRTLTVSRAMTEQLTVADSVSAAHSRSISEQLGITDNLQRSIVTARTPTEEMIVDDTVVKAVSKSVAEQLSMQDAVARAIVQSGLIPEQLGLTETIAVSMSKPLSEQIGTTDAISRIATTARAASEQLAVTDTVQAVGSKVLAEQLAATDSLQVAMGAARTSSEQMGVTDAIIKTVSKAAAESLNIGDSVVAAVVQGRSAAEQLVVQDAADRSATLSRSMTEQLGLTEAAGLTIDAAMLDQLGVADNISISITRSIADQLAFSDLIVVTAGGDAFLAEQLGVAESVAIAVSKSASDSLSMTDAVMISGSTGTAESIAMTDAVARSVTIFRTVSDSLAMADSVSGAPATFIEITDSLAIGDAFTDVSAVFHLDLGEPLVLAQGFATDFEGFFNHAEGEGIIIIDAVVLVLQSIASLSESLSLQDQLAAELINGRAMSESMQTADSIVILVTRPPPQAPPAITTMPDLMMTNKQDIGKVSGLTDPKPAVGVSGTWNIPSLSNQGLEWLLGESALNMTTYDISLEATSADIASMTMVLPTFHVQMAGEWSEDAAFLTPTLSNLPSGMQVLIPIDVESSMGGAGSMSGLGNMTVSFTPAESAGNFTMLVAILENNPEQDAEEVTGGVPAFYIDVSIVGDFGITPADEDFFAEPLGALPEVTFTVTEEWADEHDAERDPNGVPIVGLFLLDDGEWIELDEEQIEPPESAVGGVYTFTATLPHFSTYVVTAGTVPSAPEDDDESERDRDSSGRVEVVNPPDQDTPVGIEGRTFVTNLDESLMVAAVQSQPLHQRIITIHSVSVVVDIAEIRPAGLGSAVATLNFEITNKGDAQEELMLRYWYSDPATEQRVYEDEQAIMVSGNEFIIKAVEIPLGSPGVYDLMIVAESDDGTLVSTNVAIDVPWLSVYLYTLIIVAVAVVAASLAYVAFAMCRPRSFITGDE